MSTVTTSPTSRVVGDASHSSGPDDASPATTSTQCRVAVSRASSRQAPPRSVTSVRRVVGAGGWVVVVAGRGRAVVVVAGPAEVDVVAGSAVVVVVWLAVVVLVSAMASAVASP